ncbi:MAG: efflux RND transporter periplasmic adaptor subunit [Patescibacteria group bacterium]
MLKILALIKKKKLLFSVLGAIILIVLGIVLFGGKKTAGGVITVSLGDFVNQVSISGKVKAASSADLGFANSGRIGKIFIKNNQNVRSGEILAQLDIGNLSADLQIKQANLKQSDVDLTAAKDELEKVIKNEDTKIESAYLKLVSSDLEFTPDSSGYTAEVPVVSGSYDGHSGTYKAIIRRERVGSGDFSFIWTFGLEETKTVVNEEGKTPLGTKGLLILFPDDLDLYNDTIWYLDIPNKGGASYPENLNAYNQALVARNLAVSGADSKYEKLLAGDSSAEVSIALAEIDKINAEIRASTIYAPFSGIVTNVSKEVGETVSASETVITAMSKGTFEIESYVPEVNIALIEVGNEASVTLDAYGEDAVFGAKIVSIDSAETIRDGISTYKIKLLFDQEDERIRSGMTANISILVFEKPGVIVVPGGVIFERDGKKFVQLRKKKDVVDQEVVTGSTSTLGQVEIVSGLSDGDEVILNPSRE